MLLRRGKNLTSSLRRLSRRTCLQVFFDVFKYPPQERDGNQDQALLPAQGPDCWETKEQVQQGADPAGHQQQPGLAGGIQRGIIVQAQYTNYCHHAVIYSYSMFDSFGNGFESPLVLNIKALPVRNSRQSVWSEEQSYSILGLHYLV